MGKVVELVKAGDAQGILGMASVDKVAAHRAMSVRSSGYSSEVAAVIVAAQALLAMPK